MSESRFSRGQRVGIVAGVIALAGATALAGGAVGYQLGKAEGLSQAQAESRTAVPSQAGRLADSPLPSGGGAGSLSIPQLMPFDNEIPREFSAPKAYLGVRFESLNAELARQENLTVAEGAIIREVVAGGPAAKAGLQVGDVLTAVGSEPVNAHNTLNDRIAAHQPDDSIELTVLRAGETLPIKVTLTERKGVDVDGFQFRIPRDGGAPFSGDPSRCLPRGEQG
jgi:S1-C subfamily serine protease